LRGHPLKWVARFNSDRIKIDPVKMRLNALPVGVGEATQSRYQALSNICRDNRRRPRAISDCDGRQAIMFGDVSLRKYGQVTQPITQLQH